MESIRLLVERAGLVQPGFRVSDQNASALARICWRLDGMPLAIELAAARLVSLPVEEVASRLGDRFRLLTGGSRTAVRRQQTLRATIDWSHDLLSGPERVLLRRLAVFAGGLALEAAEEVCSGEGLEREAVLDLLDQLVRKSLVVAEEGGGQARYRLLETIRQYALGKLADSGESEWLCARHLEWYVGLAERVGPRLRGGTQLATLDLLAAEHDNLRAALAWSLETSPESGLRLAGSIFHFWGIRGYDTEGLRWLEGVLSRSGGEARGRAEALLGAGYVSLLLGDLPRSARYLEESLALCREVGDRWGMGRALVSLGDIRADGEPRRARALYEEGLVYLREVGDQVLSSEALVGLGMLALYEGDAGRCWELLEESLALARASGDRARLNDTLGYSVFAALDEGDYPRARKLLDETMTLARELGEQSAVGGGLSLLGNLASAEGDYDEAETFLQEGLRLLRPTEPYYALWTMLYVGHLARLRRDPIQARVSLGECLALARANGRTLPASLATAGLARVARDEGQAREAARLYREALGTIRGRGFATAVALELWHYGILEVRRGATVRGVRLMGAGLGHKLFGNLVYPPDRADSEAALDAARIALAEEAFATAWTEGQAMSLEEAVEYALAVETEAI